MSEHGMIGQAPPRTDAEEKLTGRARFVGDLRLPGMLEGKVLRSPLPHARITRIDVSRAVTLPGVRAVLTAADLPDMRYGQKIKDRTLLARDRVRFVGERVAAVAAEDIDTALEALELIRVEYEELPAMGDPLEAMQPGAPLVHPDLSIYKGVQKSLPGPNVCSVTSYGLGDPAVGFALAAHVRQDTFRTPVVHQGYMEPHVCLVDARGQVVEIWSSNKVPFELRMHLAQILNLPAGSIRLRYGHIGGDFGGKGAVMDEPLAYYLSRRTGRPVRMAMTVREELLAGNPRHASIITIKSGVDASARLAAREVQVIFDAGAYSHGIVAGARRAAGAYRIPHCRVEALAVYTNSVPPGQCRAPGDPQAFFAVESHTDLLARQLGMDPYQFRRLNALREGDVSPTGLRWENIRALEVLDEAARRINWDKPLEGACRGRGIALTERSVGVGASSALVMLQRDGSVTLVSGATDPGTGSRTVLRQIVAQEMQLPLERITLGEGDTALAPYDAGAGGSRMTHVAGQAVRLATQDALRQLLEMAASRLEVEPQAVSYQEGVFRDGDRSLTLAEVLAGSRAGNVVVGRGSYAVEKTSHTCFTAQAAEVQVDPQTGQVRVERLVSVNDIGQVIHQQGASGQVEGAVVQGLGFALQEELPHPQGRPAVAALADFKLPTALDAPDVEVCLLEGALGPGPYGSKSIAEQPVSAPAPAVANALRAVLGVDLLELPLTPERVRKACREKEQGGAGGAF